MTKLSDKLGIQTPNCRVACSAF